MVQSAPAAFPALLNDATLVKELPKPVILLEILLSCFLNGTAGAQLEAIRNEHPRALDHPGEDSAARIFKKILRVVLPLDAGRDHGIERDHLDSAFRTIVRRPQARHVAGI